MSGKIIERAINTKERACPPIITNVETAVEKIEDVKKSKKKSNFKTSSEFIITEEEKINV